jgi:hypothetical protein
MEQPSPARTERLARVIKARASPLVWIANQKSNRKESCPVRFPLFSAVWTLCTTPNEDAVTLVGGGAKFG